MARRVQRDYWMTECGGLISIALVAWRCSQPLEGSWQPSGVGPLSQPFGGLGASHGFAPSHRQPSRPARKRVTTQTWHRCPIQTICPGQEWHSRPPIQGEVNQIFGLCWLGDRRTMPADHCSWQKVTRVPCGVWPCAQARPGVDEVMPEPIRLKPNP